MKAIYSILVIFSLVGCSTQSYYADKQINTYNNYRPVNTVVGLVYNFGKSTAYSVPKGSRLKHEECVYMVLDNANPGEFCKWNTQEASGTVRVAMIRPNLCHELVSTVYYKGKTASWKDTACLTQNNKWKFYTE